MAEEYFLDLRGIACPMNFVKTKLYMDKMPTGKAVTVLLDQGEPVESVCNSIGAEGHAIESSERQSNGHYIVVIRKS